MPHDSQTILDYGEPGSDKPLRLWIPVVLLLLAYAVWYRPRLTPTFFPNGFDWAVLVLLAPGAFAMARYSSLPGWAFAAYGAGAVFLFLFANFNDNNFRASTDVHDVLLTWSAMVVAGALAGRVIAFAGRAAARK